MVKAYLDRQSVEPGAALALHATGSGRATLTIRGWQHSDPNPRGPGVLVTDCDWGAGVIDAGPEETAKGSFAYTEAALPRTGPFTVSLWLLSTSEAETSTVLSWRGSSSSWSLIIDGGRLALRGEGGDTVSSLRVRPRQWTFLAVAVPDVSESSSPVTLAAGHWGRTGGPFVEEVTPAVQADTASSALWIGAPADGRSGDLDGVVAGVSIHQEALDIVALMDVMNGVGPEARHRWDMSIREDPDHVAPLGAATPALALYNAPAWSTQVPPPISSNGQRVTTPGSIHFHTDDVEDCGWPVVHTIDVPPETPSGIYTARLVDGAGATEVPFVVAGRSAVMLLAPTLTWQAYGNLGRDPDTWPGRSLYSLHADGSPVLVNTALRPCPTLEPQARLEVDGGDGFAEGTGVVAHLLMADLYAWHWLTEGGFSPAVMDDRELHARGYSALDGVRVLVLSAHPEYWTSAMLDALDRFVEDGGSVVYLGGNGLYWVTSLHPTKPHLMEVRRWGGSQTWSVEEADRPHQYEQCLGGLWADAKRPPNLQVGVGFAGFGAGPSLTYVRTEASYSEEWSWVFEGVNTTEFGGDGINVGVGNEFDSFDPLVAAPGRTTVLATAQPVTPDHFATFEGGPGRAPNPKVRADLAVTATPGGGLILAVSSITASGCLVVTEGPKTLRRVCTNILEHMVANSRPHW